MGISMSKRTRVRSDGDRLTTWPTPIAHATGPLSGRVLTAAWSEFLGRLQWDFLLTLTFRRPNVDRRRAERDARLFCQWAEQAATKPVGFAYAIEVGRRGRLHCHLLVIGITTRSGLDAPLAMWRARNGITDCRNVYEPVGASFYLTKDSANCGDVSISDSLPEYASRVTSGTRVELCPE